MGNKYLTEFFNLRCAGDILNTIYPANNLEKEITESMAIINKIKHLILGLEQKNKEITLIDAGSGNALTPLLATFIYKNVNSIAVDKNPRERNYSEVKRFNYYEYSFTGVIDDNCDFIRSTNPSDSIILTGVHACKNLTKYILYTAKNLNAYVATMPCCVGSLDRKHTRYDFMSPSKYQKWIIQLLEENRFLRAYEDKYIIGPKNIIIHNL